MFLQKKRTINWPAVLFGAIGVGIVVATAVLVVVFIKKNTEHAERTATYVNETSPVALQQAYAVEVSGLRARIEENNLTGEALLNEIETMIISTRVPKERMNRHLQALFEVQDLKKNSASKSDADMRAEALAIVDSMAQE